MTDPTTVDALAGELLPCPFCGGEPSVSSHETESLWSPEIVTYTTVRCDECEVFFSTEPGYELEAIAAWNRRSDEDRKRLQAELTASGEIRDKISRALSEEQARADHLQARLDEAVEALRKALLWTDEEHDVGDWREDARALVGGE